MSDGVKGRGIELRHEGWTEGMRVVEWRGEGWSEGVRGGAKGRWPFLLAS